MTPDLPKMTCAIPLGEDPLDDPPMELMLEHAALGLSDLAATRGLHAVDVELVEISSGIYDETGHYAIDEETGAPIMPRLALFTARAMRI